MKIESTSLWQSIAEHFLPSQVEVQCTSAVSGGFSSAQVVRVVTSIGDFALRGTPCAQADEQTVLCRHHWQKELANSGIPVPVPQQEQTTGRTLLQHDNQFWQMETWLPGKSVTGSEITPSQVAAMMAQIAKLHQASATSSATGADSAYQCRTDYCPTVLERRQIINWWTPARLVIASDSISKAPTEFRLHAEMILAEFLSQAMVLDNELKQLENIPFALIPCARDLWQAHVLFTGDQVTGVIDLNVSRVDHIATDLSRLLGSFFGSDPTRWQHALAEYETHRPLTPLEHQLLRALDRSSVVLSGMTWINRWYHGHVTQANLLAVVERMQNLTTVIATRNQNSGHFFSRSN
ncbi:phosphotransferase [Planctomicrobium sp. SH527]|uniref:phosphotransferase n=1 Tax=Planctomicrobium sp. SH527 TaxID=3448123 RepID=UPI003F5B283A